MTHEKEKRLQLLGSDIRLLIGAGPEPDFDLLEAEAYLRDFQDTLSRFDPRSELSRLNAAKEERVHISPLLYDALQEALRAAEMSGGLVDPTMLPEIEGAGYKNSWRREQAVSLQEALEKAPSPHPASPAAEKHWQQIRLEEGGFVCRPPGVGIDLGGVGKGMAADRIAARFAPYTSWCVDLGGDMRLGGSLEQKREVLLPSPLGEGLRFLVSGGAVATSGIYRRIWMQDGTPRHHLLDPASGNPVWSGVLQATAFSDRAADAERLAKTALLLGPESAHLLEEKGGALLLDSGEWMVVGDIERAF